MNHETRDPRPETRDPKPELSMNLLNTPIDYQIIETPTGIWKRYLYPSGWMYREFTSHAKIAGLPVIHIVFGRNPETGKIGTARGIIAIGQKARGVLAIGQLAFGVIAIGQLAIGMLVGIGQATCGVIAIGQGAVGVITIAQLGIGRWVLAQVGIGAKLF